MTRFSERPPGNSIAHGARLRDDEVHQSLTRSSKPAPSNVAFRMLTEPGYAIRVMRYLAGLPTPLRTTDRILLETTVFDYYRASPDIRSILFVGSDWYTRHYERAYFSSKNYWTLDPAKSARKFGARQHVLAPLEELEKHFAQGYFDLIICNGVYGYGLNTISQCESAFDQCCRALSPGGQFLLGWDDIPEHTPVPLAEIASLRPFSRYEFPPLGTSRYLTATPYRHTYDFYRAPL